MTSAYPDLNLNVIMRQGAYEGNVQLHGIPLGAMKNIKLGEGSLPTTETKDMEMVVGNMVAQNFSNAKTGKGYWDTGEMPDIDFINKPMFTIFDTDAYYQSKGNSGGDDGSQKVAAPKKYMLKTAGMVAGGPDEWSDYSYGVYVDLDKLKTQLKQVFKKKPIPGQPTNKKGKPYNYFVYEEATVNVDDMDHVIEVQKAISNMGYEANSQMEWLEQSKQQSNMIQAALGGIGAVSLLVAAIGIANTMMMSIYERTKEIGIIKVLGCGVEVKDRHAKEMAGFDLSALRWNKVVICTDADVDGFQIRTLILTMLYRLTPTLIQEGYVYIAESPLFEITCKGDTWFAYSNAEKDSVVAKLKGKKCDIQRSKGLGENDPDMMWLTTMNPDTRRLIKVMPEDVKQTATMFDLLLGDDLQGRKNYIASDGHLFLDLADIS